MSRQNLLNLCFFALTSTALIVAALTFQRVAAIERAMPTLKSTIERRLSEHQELLGRLRAPEFQEPGLDDPLSAYLARVRRDGVAKHSEMKALIDTLSQNGIATAALLEAYEPESRTERFKSEARAFRAYAGRLAERTNSLFETFMLGGGLPPGGLSYPPGLASALDSEY